MEQHVHVETLQPFVAERDPYKAPAGMDFRTWMDYRKGLAAKKSAVRSKIRHIAKNGVNEDGNYSYTTSADIFDRVSEVMHEYRLGFDPELLSANTPQTQPGRAAITTAMLRVTWTDLETGYFEEQEWEGAGADFGDKGIYKAYTGAAKYALVLNFLIPMGGNDPAPGSSDPEKESTEKEPATRKTDEAAATAREVGRAVANAANGRTKSEKAKEEDKAVKESSGDEAEALPITSEQVGAIKLLVGEMAAFAEPAARKDVAKGTYTSVAVKLKIRSLDEKTLTLLNADQAAIAIANLETWVAKRHEKEAEIAAANARALGGQTDA